MKNLNVKKNNDWSDLETFEHTGVKIKIPYVTISKRKTITLSKGFCHYSKNKILDMTHVILSFSKLKNAIVFNFIKNSETLGATKMTRKGNVSISASAFFNYYFMDISKISGKYIAKLENIPNNGEYWVIYLNKNNL